MDIEEKRRRIARKLVREAGAMTHRVVNNHGFCVLRNASGEACLIGRILTDRAINGFNSAGVTVIAGSSEMARNQLAWGDDPSWQAALVRCQQSHDTMTDGLYFGERLSKRVQESLKPWLGRKKK
jgi:hypothetical protein